MLNPNSLSLHKTCKKGVVTTFHRRKRIYSPGGERQRFGRCANAHRPKERPLLGFIASSV